MWYKSIFCETLPMPAFKIALYHVLESAWVLFRALHATPLNFDQKSAQRKYGVALP